MEGPVEVKKSLKELRSELKMKRSEGSVPISKLSRASVMAELSKYSVAKPVKVVEEVVEEPKAEVPKKKRPTNSKVKVVEEVEKPLSVKVPKKVKVVEVHEPKTPKPKAEAKPEPKAEVKSKKPLTAYQQLWGEARKRGLSPKEASDYAKSKL